MKENDKGRPITKSTYIISIVTGITFLLVIVVPLLLYIGASWEVIVALMLFAVIMSISKILWDNSSQDRRLRIIKLFPYVRIVEVFLLCVAIYTGRFLKLKTLAGIIILLVVLFDVIFSVNIKMEKKKPEFEFKK